MATPSFGLPIGGTPRVNLMPRSEIERRERRVLLQRWLVALIGTLIVTVIMIAVTFGVKMVADLRLANENARTLTLLSDLSSLSDVSNMLKQQSALTDYRTLAMGTELTWVPLLATVTSVLPAAATISNFEAEAGFGPRSEDPALAPGATVMLTVTSPTPIDIVTAIRSLRATPTLLHADGRELRKEGTATVAEDEDAPPPPSTYLLTLTTTEEVYTGRFLPETTEPATEEED